VVEESGLSPVTGRLSSRTVKCCAFLAVCLLPAVGALASLYGTALGVSDAFLTVGSGIGLSCEQMAGLWKLGGFRARPGRRGASSAGSGRFVNGIPGLPASPVRAPCGSRSGMSLGRRKIGHKAATALNNPGGRFGKELAPGRAGEGGWAGWRVTGASPLPVGKRPSGGELRFARGVPLSVFQGVSAEEPAGPTLGNVRAWRQYSAARPRGWVSFLWRADAIPPVPGRTGHHEPAGGYGTALLSNPFPTPRCSR
jgi:hypothetical protein